MFDERFEAKDRNFLGLEAYDLMDIK